MGKVQFNLNGKEATAGGPGPRTQQFIDFVRNIPNGKYFNIQGISDCIKATRRSGEHASRNALAELEGHYMRVPCQSSGGASQLIFGSKKGVQALTKSLKEQGLI